MILDNGGAVLIRYLLSWFLLAIVAVANGVAREATYGKYVPELWAHQISTVTAILLTGLLVWWLSRLWPIGSPGQAWFIGVCWLLGTITFEFVFGRLVAGHSWAELVADYNLFRGRVWLLFLVWVAVMPYVFFRLG